MSTTAVMEPVSIGGAATSQAAATTPKRLAIDEKQFAGLSPEWIELWDTHGAHMTRADEVSIEEYRKDPAFYSFTYPTCAGTLEQPLRPSAMRDMLTFPRP